MMITFLEDNSFCQNVNLLMFVLKTNRKNIFLANWDENVINSWSKNWQIIVINQI